MKKYICISAFIVLIIAIILTVIGQGAAIDPDSNPHQIDHAMIWFEFLSSPEELPLVLGTPGSPDDLRADLNLANYVDFAFLLAYPGFHITLFLFFLSIPNLRKLKWLNYFGILLAAIMLVGDLVENIQLLILADPEIILEADGTYNTIWVLFVSTRIKWWAIFIASGILSWNFFQWQTSHFRKFMAFLFLVSMFLGITGLIYQFSYVQLALKCMALAWILVFIYFVRDLYAEITTSEATRLTE